MVAPLRTHARRTRASQRYAAVLLLVLATFVFIAFAPDTAWSRGVLLLMESATLLAALWTAVPGPLRYRLLIPLLAIGLAAAQLQIGGRTLTSAAIVLNGLFVVGTICVIARAVIRDRDVNAHSVIGAICVYLLMGMLFAFMYGLTALLGSGPLFANGADATSSIRLYFSYVTLTTVGYGDYVPVGDVGRTLSNLESIFGQLYLVTVIGVMVSRIPPSRR